MVGDSDNKDFFAMLYDHDVIGEPLEPELPGSSGARGTGHGCEGNDLFRKQVNCRIDRSRELNA